MYNCSWKWINFIRTLILVYVLQLGSRSGFSGSTFQGNSFTLLVLIYCIKSYYSRQRRLTPPIKCLVCRLPLYSIKKCRTKCECSNFHKWDNMDTSWMKGLKTNNRKVSTMVTQFIFNVLVYTPCNVFIAFMQKWLFWNNTTTRPRVKNENVIKLYQ